MIFYVIFYVVLHADIYVRYEISFQNLIQEIKNFKILNMIEHSSNIFLQFAKQAVMICGTSIDEFEEIVHVVPNNFMDCFNIIQDLIDKIVSAEAIQPISNIVSYINFCFF